MSRHGDDCRCFRCKLDSLQFSPAAMSTYNSKPPQPVSNSWERGVVRDQRSMPFLNEHGTPIGVHEWASKRSKFESTLRNEVTSSS